MKKNMVWLFYLLFAVCFAFVVVNVILQNPYYKTFYLIIVTLLSTAGLVYIYKKLNKCEKKLEKNYKKILIIFAVVMFVIELIAGITLRFDPEWDIGAIHKGAIE